MSRNPEGLGSIPRLGSRRSSLISIEHAELPNYIVGAVLCLAITSNHGIACICTAAGANSARYRLLGMTNEEQNKRHPPVVVKLTVPLYK